MQLRLKAAHLKFYSIIAFFFVSSVAVAEIDDQQVWSSLQLSHQIESKHQIGFSLELQNRASVVQNDFVEDQFRTTLFKTFTDKSTGSIGYLYRQNDLSERLENRLWLQWSKPYQIRDDWGLNVRTRLEHRELNLDSPSQRFRLALRLENKQLNTETLSPYVSSEFFYNINTVEPSIEAGVKQFRNLIGARYEINKKFSLDSAFGLQTLVQNDNQQTQNLIYLLSLNIKP